MTRLAIGVLLFCMVHLVPAFVADIKNEMIRRFGENAYKGVFGGLIILSLYLIITGWSFLTPTEPEVLNAIYTAPDWGGYAAAILVLICFILFFAPYPPNNIKRVLRHPQLTGLACWGLGHLLAVGTARSIVLFGGLTLWALVEILLINKRDGEWRKPEKAPVKNDVALVLFSVLVYMAFLFTHHLLFGGTNLI